MASDALRARSEQCLHLARELVAELIERSDAELRACEFRDERRTKDGERAAPQKGSAGGEFGQDAPEGRL